MYSYEIQDYLQRRSYHLETYDELQNIIDTSPQIIRVKLDYFNDRYTKYYLKANDDYEWLVWIKNYER